MTDKLELDPGRTALLIMDYQVDIVARLGDAHPHLLERVGAVLDAARRAGMRVVYVAVGFRPGYPEISARNQTFAPVVSTGAFLAGPGAKIHASVAPLPDEVVVQKHRVSAFFGTDLDMILRANGIETLVLCGIATSGVVLSTLRYAADSDYRVVVIEDGCADADPAVHRSLIDKVFPRQARVVQATDFAEALTP